MYLKSLEIQGFKSFPDKVKLSFNRGMTSVIGPNGSGKSNISDAVRWVLGEQSTKNLRSARMDEVMESRQVYVAQPGGAQRLQPVEAVPRYAAVAAPILAAGDITGAVCLVQPESGTVPGEGDVRLAQVAAAFLGKQMEE